MASSSSRERRDTRPTLLVPGNLRSAAEGEGPAEAADRRAPIEYITDWIKRRMPEFGAPPPRGPEDRILVVKAKTGSGKSTVLPTHIFRLLRDPRAAGAPYAGRTVLCTQPRILTAISLAVHEIAGAPEHYPDFVLGRTVGYQTGPVSEGAAAGLLFATAATLLEQLRLWTDGEIIDRYHTIIIDEVHERSLSTDGVLMQLKAFAERGAGNPRFPFIILASATIPAAKYAAYFGLGPANVVEVEGRAYKVRFNFPKVGTNDFVKGAAETALRIHRENPRDPPGSGDILLFVPGLEEIKGVVRLLEAGAKGRAPFLTLILTREVVTNQPPDYYLVQAPPDALRVSSGAGGGQVRPTRRIIVATVVAETGLTIPTLKYVIDCGWSRSLESYFPQNVGGLLTRPAPRSRILQRAGRAGRKFDGEFYPLYTRNVYDALAEDQLPEVITQGVGAIFLDIARATAARASPPATESSLASREALESADAARPVFRVEEIDMLDPPPADALATALETAVVCGFLGEAPPGASRAGHVLTPAGETAARLGDLGAEGAQMEAARVLLGGYLWRVSLQDLATIVALFGPRSVSDFFVRPRPGEAGPGPGDPPADLEALLAGVPDHFRAAARRPGAGFAGGGPRASKVPPSEREAPYYRARLVLADDFLEGLLIFEGFARALEATAGNAAELRAWCAGRKLSYDTLLAFAGWRDRIINRLAAAGMNPFWGAQYRLAEAASSEFGDVVVRLKRCLYEGLRANLLAYDPGANVYRTRRGDPVAVPDRFSDHAMARLEALGGERGRLQKPALLVTNAVRIQGVPPARGVQLNLYRLAAARVSVLDGYVEPDPAFYAPRPAAV